MFVSLLMLAACTEYDFHTQPDEAEVGPAQELIDEPVFQDPLPEVDPSAENQVPIADALVYANTSDELFEVDPLSGDTKFVGIFRNSAGTVVDGFVDIAIDLGGVMYGGTFEALYRINPTTAQVEWVCDTSVDMLAMTFLDDGTLVAGGAERIETLDVDDCRDDTLLVSAVYETSGDLVGLPDGFLYWTVRGNNGDELVRVDPTTGVSVWVGPIGVDRLFGLGYDEEQLYGFGSGGEIVRISPIGAASSVLSQDDGTSWWGATTNPVKW